MSNYGCEETWGEQLSNTCSGTNEPAVLIPRIRSAAHSPSGIRVTLDPQEAAAHSMSGTSSHIHEPPAAVALELSVEKPSGELGTGDFATTATLQAETLKMSTVQQNAAPIWDQTEASMTVCLQSRAKHLSPLRSRTAFCLPHNLSPHAKCMLTTP